MVIFGQHETVGLKCFLPEWISTIYNRESCRYEQACDDNSYICTIVSLPPSVLYKASLTRTHGSDDPIFLLELLEVLVDCKSIYFIYCTVLSCSPFIFSVSILTSTVCMCERERNKERELQ